MIETKIERAREKKKNGRGKRRKERMKATVVGTANEYEISGENMNGCTNKQNACCLRVMTGS